jgi:hypothetical protein
MIAPASSTFRFLHLPKELRLMVYEYLLVARIHRKLNNTITVVVVWSPACILRASRVVNEEASAIVKKAAQVYKTAGRNVPFSPEWDLMPKLLGHAGSWNAPGVFGDIPGLFYAALEWEAYLRSRIPPTGPWTQTHPAQAASCHAKSMQTIEWAQHAADLLLLDAVQSELDVARAWFDIAVLTSSYDQYCTFIDCSNHFYERPLSNSNLFPGSDILALELDRKLNVIFTVASLDFCGDDSDEVMGEMERDSGVRGCTLLAAQQMGTHVG